jgi:hypothetical protein
MAKLHKGRPSRNTKNSLSGARRLGVFISHDTRDAKLAQAFGELLKSVSKGQIKTFQSEDTPFGHNWFPRLMAELNNSSEVICLFTERSIGRPWILFEAGVAKGLSNISVIGVALHIPISRVNDGPFYNFQNMIDTPAEMRKLINELARARKLKLDKDVLNAQIKAFKEKENTFLSKLQADTVLISEPSVPFGRAVFKWLDLSDGARQTLGRSKFIPIGGTRRALMKLTRSARKGDSISAICGNKGDYSSEYYKENFKQCKQVKRIFSYDAILSEMQNGVRYALNGVELHLNKRSTGKCKVQLLLIPKGKRIEHLGNRDFHPPLSFGLAILRDKKAPKEAILHWEIDAASLKHLIPIEGVIVDGTQKELLNRLVELHDSIAGSDPVLSSSSRRQRKLITNAIKELEREWNRLQHGKQGGEV